MHFVEELSLKRLYRIIRAHDEAIAYGYAYQLVYMNMSLVGVTEQERICRNGDFSVPSCFNSSSTATQLATLYDALPQGTLHVLPHDLESSIDSHSLNALSLFCKPVATDSVMNNLRKVNVNCADIMLSLLHKHLLRGGGSTRSRSSEQHSHSLDLFTGNEPSSGHSNIGKQSNRIFNSSTVYWALDIDVEWVGNLPSILDRISRQPRGVILLEGITTAAGEVRASLKKIGDKWVKNQSQGQQKGERSGSESDFPGRCAVNSEDDSDKYNGDKNEVEREAVPSNGDVFDYIGTCIRRSDDYDDEETTITPVTVIPIDPSDSYTNGATNGNTTKTNLDDENINTNSTDTVNCGLRPINRALISVRRAIRNVLQRVSKLCRRVVSKLKKRILDKGGKSTSANSSRSAVVAVDEIENNCSVHCWQELSRFSGTFLEVLLEEYLKTTVNHGGDIGNDSRNNDTTSTATSGSTPHSELGILLLGRRCYSNLAKSKSLAYRDALQSGLQAGLLYKDFVPIRATRDGTTTTSYSRNVSTHLKEYEMMKAQFIENAVDPLLFDNRPGFLFRNVQ